MVLFLPWRGWLPWEQGIVGSWEWEAWKQVGLARLDDCTCRRPTSCLQMSQHISVMSLIKFSPVLAPLGILSGQKDPGALCVWRSAAPSPFRRPQEAWVSTHLAGVHRGGPSMGGEMLLGNGFQPEPGIPGEDLAEKDKFVVHVKGPSQSKIIFIVIITGVNNMSSEFFSILDLVFMFLTTLGSFKKKKIVLFSLYRKRPKQGRDGYR